MLSARGKLLLFADADGASKFSHIEKLEDCMKKTNTEEVSKDAEDKLTCIYKSILFSIMVYASISCNNARYILLHV